MTLSASFGRLPEHLFLRVRRRLAPPLPTDTAVAVIDTKYFWCRRACFRILHSDRFLYRAFHTRESGYNSPFGGEPDRIRICTTHCSAPGFFPGALSAPFCWYGPVIS